jgi:hypothetical protein
MDVEVAAKQRSDALRILDRAAHGEGFAQIFAGTSAFAKDRDFAFEEQLQIFHSLLCDLLELTSGMKEPALRNAILAKELQTLAKTIDSRWVMRAVSGIDELHLGSRRNLNRQLGMDSLAAALALDSKQAHRR